MRKQSQITALCCPKTFFSSGIFPICFSHPKLALYRGHMVTFKLIANISQTTLQLQSAFLVALISKTAGMKSA